MDETLALPSEKAAEIALRTQQLIAFETGVANVADPLGGSYFVENLTDQLEDDAENYFKEIDKLGGVIPAIEKGYFQYEISRSASSHQKKIDNRELIHVGVNDYIKSDEEIEIPILEIGKEAEDFQKKSIKSLKNNRNSQAVDSSLAKIKDAAKSDKNLLPPIIEAANSFATIGEIVISLKEEFGEWNETSVF
jgi:Methylmalonyl-CoA mutase, N-terminal domain/subunit